MVSPASADCRWWWFEANLKLEETSEKFALQWLKLMVWAYDMFLIHKICKLCRNWSMH